MLQGISMEFRPGEHGGHRISLSFLNPNLPKYSTAEELEQSCMKINLHLNATVFFLSHN